MGTSVLVVALAIAGPLLLSGSLASGEDARVIRFSAIRETHFEADGVKMARGPPSSDPLVFRVSLIGDAAETVDFSQAVTFLARSLNVEVEWDDEGLPIFVTAHDLAAKSGRATLGATVSNGIAVEARDAGIANCVFAHEIGHALGLEHSADPSALMGEHCTRTKLASSTVSANEVSHVAAISSITARLPEGVVTWASRGST